jgi:hypothetical protein
MPLEGNTGGIRAHVDAVKAAVANETTSISAEELLPWSKWKIPATDRIRSREKCPFYKGLLKLKVDPK